MSVSRCDHPRARCVPASSRSSSSLGSSMVGVAGRGAFGAVNPEVVPWKGPCSCIGELRISSRDGIGRLRTGRQFFNLAAKNNRSPLLTADLTRSPGLRTNFSAEGVDLVDDQLLHAFDAVFLLKAKVEFLLIAVLVGRHIANGGRLTDSHIGSSAGSCHTWR